MLGTEAALSTATSSTPAPAAMPGFAAAASLSKGDGETTPSNSLASKPVETSGEAAPEPPISCPLVLQCAACRTIVGDTCTLLDLNSEYRTITTQKKGDGAMVDDLLNTSLAGMDYGSTYHMLKCRHCHATLGRMYRTTSPELDHWRGFYTFSSDVLCFYELSGQFPSAAPSMMEVDASSNATLRRNDVGALEISKLQKFCLYLYERVTDLEEKLAACLERSSLAAETRQHRPTSEGARTDHTPLTTPLASAPASAVAVPRPIESPHTPATAVSEGPASALPTGEVVVVKKRGRGRPPKPKDPAKVLPPPPPPPPPPPSSLPPTPTPAPSSSRPLQPEASTPLKQVFPASQDADFQT